MLDYGSLPKQYSLRLILIRHGEPWPDTKGRCYGRLDIGLSDIGLRQIQDKVHSIGPLSAGALYASPVKRALESAAIAGVSLQLRPIVCPDLQEIDFGRFEGLTYDEIEKLYPNEFRLWMERPAEINFPAGESFAEVKLRVLRFKNLLLKTHHRETVIAVSHGGTNRIMLADALGIPDHKIFCLDQAHAAVNIIDYLEEFPVVRLVNG
jgi:alpha-ribazole phosphatase/probable phosphoglycerate mutase